MLKGLVTSPKKEPELQNDSKKKELNLRPEEGSLTAHWINKKH